MLKALISSKLKGISVVFLLEKLFKTLHIAQFFIGSAQSN